MHSVTTFVILGFLDVSSTISLDIPSYLCLIDVDHIFYVLKGFIHRQVERLGAAHYFLKYNVNQCSVHNQILQNWTIIFLR